MLIYMQLNIACISAVSDSYEDLIVFIGVKYWLFNSDWRNGQQDIGPVGSSMRGTETDGKSIESMNLNTEETARDRLFIWQVELTLR